jgi:phosphotransacetylase
LEEINNTQTNSFKLLLTIIEGNEDKELIQKLSKNIDINMFVKILKKEFKQYVKKNLKLSDKKEITYELIKEKVKKKKIFEGSILQAFNIYIFLQRIKNADIGEKS